MGKHELKKVRLSRLRLGQLPESKAKQEATEEEAKEVLSILEIPWAYNLDSPNSLRSLTKNKESNPGPRERAREIVGKLESGLGKPLEEMDSISLARFIRGIIWLLCKERWYVRLFARWICILEQYEKLRNQMRIDTRPDQTDKHAFQEAVQVNQEDYPTMAEAVRDLQEKPQFEKYRVATLRNWTREVWTKPKKVGRPKKIIN